MFWKRPSSLWDLGKEEGQATICDQCGRRLRCDSGGGRKCIDVGQIGELLLRES